MTEHNYLGVDEDYNHVDIVKGEVIISHVWRWMCSCGARGHWQYQSPSCCLFSHARHALAKQNTEYRLKQDLITH